MFSAQQVVRPELAVAVAIDDANGCHLEDIRIVGVVEAAGGGQSLAGDGLVELGGNGTELSTGNGLGVVNAQTGLGHDIGVDGLGDNVLGPVRDFDALQGVDFDFTGCAAESLGEHGPCFVSHACVSESVLGLCGEGVDIAGLRGDGDAGFGTDFGDISTLELVGSLFGNNGDEVFVDAVFAGIERRICHVGASDNGLYIGTVNNKSG